jgi:guanylate kinase
MNLKTLILVDGAAGTGKSDLAKYLIKSKNKQVKLAKKYSTRFQRDEEKDTPYTDIHFPSDSHDEFMERTKDADFYWYTYGNKETGENLYGIYKKDIIGFFDEVDYVVAIVRGFDAIQEIKLSLKDIRCISVFVYTDRDLVVKRLKVDGYDDEEIKFRLSRQPIAWGDYMKNSHLYDEKIINSSNYQDYENVINQLFIKLKKPNFNTLVVSSTKELPLVKSLIGFRETMEERIAKYPYEKNVFLMMKFRDTNERVYKYIQKTLENNGYNCVRADEPEWDITRNTYNPTAALYCCKFGIALFGEPEPKNEYSANVAYELGMMHSQLKECLVLRHSDLESAPFDLVKELYINYQDNLELEDVINNWVSKLPRHSGGF